MEYNASNSSFQHLEGGTYGSKLLIDKGMKKKDLQFAAGISSGVITKMGKGEDVTTTVLAKICKALDCNIGDIMEFVDDKE